MAKLAGDILNRVHRLPKPSKAMQALQPMFEGVSNAFHAINDKFKDSTFKDGRVRVKIDILDARARNKAFIEAAGV